jgi:hypothetical protein
MRIKAPDAPDIIVSKFSINAIFFSGRCERREIKKERGGSRPHQKNRPLQRQKAR